MNNQQQNEKGLFTFYYEQQQVQSCEMMPIKTKIKSKKRKRKNQNKNEEVQASYSHSTNLPINNHPEHHFLKIILERKLKKSENQLSPVCEKKKDHTSLHIFKVREKPIPIQKVPEKKLRYHTLESGVHERKDLDLKMEQLQIKNQTQSLNVKMNFYSPEKIRVQSFERKPSTSIRQISLPFIKNCQKLPSSYKKFQIRNISDIKKRKNKLKKEIHEPKLKITSQGIINKISTIKLGYVKDENQGWRSQKKKLMRKVGMIL